MKRRDKVKVTHGPRVGQEGEVINRPEHGKVTVLFADGQTRTLMRHQVRKV